MEKSKKRLIASVVAALMLVSALAALGCAPQAATGGAGGDGAPPAEAGADAEAAAAAAFEWSAESDCATCHSAEGASMEDTACAASAHASQGCAGCHADASGLEAAHADVAMGDRAPKRLKSTSVEEATCPGCHGSYEELAARTADSSALTDKSGTVVNPHDLPESGDHGGIACNDCHSVHEAAPAADTAAEYCRSCHHMDVYECGTCHE